LTIVEESGALMSSSHRSSASGAEVLVFPDAQTAASAAAAWLAEVIERARRERGHAVLGLPTGSTPKAVYVELINRHAAGSLSFEDVTTFNLDEYYPISPFDPRSYRFYMHEHLFKHVDLIPHCAHLFDGTIPESFASSHAAEYDQWIDEAGGLDVQLLGIGRNGHIAFNEPSDMSVEEALALPSRLVDLHEVTRADAAREFGGPDRVIPRALTMGLAPILAARSIVVLVTGAHKAEITAAALRAAITTQNPASLLRTAGKRVTWLLDEPAAAGLA
jgi:glucosamine-6-phosphate deaminase